VRRVAAVVIGLSLALTGCARSEARPSGVAEAWLHEISRLGGPPGLHEQARDRADDLGDESAAEQIIPARPEPGEDYFSDFEVGQARISDDTALVPYRLSARTITPDGELERVVKAGTLVLARSGGSWRVAAAAGPDPELKVPSQGGPLPARARTEHWLAALGLGVVLTVISVLVVDRQPRPSPV
jgi:hypothetical protein